MVMGNVSGGGRSDGADTSGVIKKEGEQQQQYMDFAESTAAAEVVAAAAHVNYHAPVLFPETTMAVHPPPPPPLLLHSPIAFLSPLNFTPQVPMVPLQRGDEIMQIQSHELMQRNSTECVDDLFKQKLPTMLTWTHGGKQVAVEGSWDNWTTKEPLQRWGDDFVVVKMLPSGVYHYRFIVDGKWMYTPNMPWAQDDMGHVSNILDLQGYVSEAVESRSVFESPPSPESSYNNTLDDSFYEKDPPPLPPQLHTTLLNVPPTSTDNKSLARPQHAVLNHLYIQERTTDPSVVALGSTHRFQGKYVTVELYKPSQNCKSKKSSQ